MLRKFACAAVIVVMGLGVALADEFQATITKVDNGKVTFRKGKAKDTGEAVTLPVMGDVKVTKGKFNRDTKKVEAGDPIEKGLQNAQFSKIGDKGLRATITTDATNTHITAIIVAGAKKKATE